jgi:hypothetical protein
LAIVGHANAESPKFTPEQVEDMTAISAMAEHVKKLPTQQRDSWEKTAAIALLFDEHCEKLPQKMGVAMTGIMAGDPETFLSHKNKIDHLREFSGTSEFCSKLKPGIEKLKQEFGSRGI